MKTNDYKQFIADIYHCSGCWGSTTTPAEMKANLIEWESEGIEDCPNINMAANCAAYWNELAQKYPGTSRT